MQKDHSRNNTTVLANLYYGAVAYLSKCNTLVAGS